MTRDQNTQQNPLEQEPKPPFPRQQQAPTGLEGEVTPRPDYGQESYRGLGRLEGRAAAVTGADSGIGRAVALAFAREGADVLISYLEADEDARVTEEAVRAAGRKAVVVRGDVGDESVCQQIIQRAMDEFGKIDALVNNAAYQQSHESITEIPSDEWDRVSRTNIYAMFYLCKAAVPHLKPGACIINTAYVQAYKPSPSLLHYAATKAATVDFTKALAQELGKKGIRVNSVAPGPVWTPLIPMSMPAEQVSKFGKDTSLGRPAPPVELAPAYVFLASQEASYVNGEVLGVHGGTPLMT